MGAAAAAVPGQSSVALVRPAVAVGAAVVAAAALLLLLLLMLLWFLVKAAVPTHVHVHAAAAAAADSTAPMHAACMPSAPVCTVAGPTSILSDLLGTSGQPEPYEREVCTSKLCCPEVCLASGSATRNIYIC